MSNSAPQISEKQRELIKDKIARGEPVSKGELRALYKLTGNLFRTWMLTIDNISIKIPNWRKQKLFKPAEVQIIIKNFGEI